MSGSDKNRKNNGAVPAKDAGKLVDISKKTFIQVVALLLALMIAAIVLTYVIPAGEFGTNPDGSTDFLSYRRLENEGGISPLKGIFAPILVFFSSNGLTLLMLSIFLIMIFAAFQVMSDVGGIRVMIGAVAERFKKRRALLIASVTLVMMCFGALLGQFEETLAVLPVMTALCVLIGLDSFTGFLISVIACGYGFASAITNPFTVLLASRIIDADPMEHIWYRIVIFFVMYLLLLGFIFLYVRRINKRPETSLTYEHDARLRAPGEAEKAANEGRKANEGRIKAVYAVFIAVCLALLILFSATPALRDYTVPVLAAYFLIFGIAAGIAAGAEPRFVLKSFLKGVVGALPTIAFIALASSIKYIFDEGHVMPTIVNAINTVAAGRSPYAIVLLIYAVVLVLEFFISSSTAKAVLVMGLLAAVNVGLTKTELVLAYTFADGYTNVIFPTSPVLLIGLSMIEVSYFKWIKKSWPLMLINLALVIGFLLLGVAINY